MEYTSFPALGSDAVVGVTRADALGTARAEVEGVVDQIDRACSRFREDSELSAVNAAQGRPVQVSPLMLDAVEVALRAARLTGGDVDPTVGQALVALGYDTDFAQLRPRAPSFATVPGWTTIKVDRATSTVSLSRGVMLDLGSTAKALAADLAAAAAAQATGAGVLVSLGGDISVAGPAPAGGWRVRVTDDHRAEETAPGQTISISSGGLATSSTTTRRWMTEAGPAHHLIDPATGQPANGPWRTVSVAAASCLDANIASTAAVIRGERAIQWLESLGVPSRLVAHGGTVRHLAGWPEEGDDLLEFREARPRPVRAPA